MRKAIRSTRAVWLQAALMLQSDRPQTGLDLVDSMLIDSLDLVKSDRPQTGLDLVDSMLIDSLDLVIAVCTSVAHLAAALGKPTWIALDTIDTNAHWAWQLERTDSPSYPTATLYRQKECSTWEPVMDDLARGLSAI